MSGLLTLIVQTIGQFPRQALARHARLVLKVFKFSLPVWVWAFTAAPSFLETDNYKGLNTLAYAYPSGKEPKLANDLFDRQAYRPVIDTAVGNIYNALSANNLNEALKITNELLAEFPNFHLAHMIKGDILSLKSGRALSKIGDMPKVPRGKEGELHELQEEAIARFKAVKDRPLKDLLPSEMLEVSDLHKYIVLIDTSRSRLFLYENTFPQPRLVTDFYISQGKMGAVKLEEGDKRTPIGVYTVTDLLPKEKLSDFYGPIALPINYPNAWDKRMGKTGFGIWLHGMPSSYVSRPPLASDGCVVLANNDLLALKKFVDIGSTPVVISERLDFVALDVWHSQRKAALRLVQNWKDDLEKGIDSGSQYYASDVVINGLDLLAWQKDKQLINKPYGKIKIDDITVMRYPSDKDMMLVTFKQSDSIVGSVKKEQYWMKMGTRWQIVQEDTIKI